MLAEGLEPKFKHNWRYLCGTMYEMPIEPPLDELLSAADRAVAHAIGTRKAHARKSKRGGRQRETDISIALERIAAAMKPIRRKVARLSYSSVEIDGESLRGASQSLQRERRKLWKMTKPDKEPK